MDNQSSRSNGAQSRNIARRDRLVDMIDNLYANASRFGWSQDRTLDVLTTVFADDTYKRLPQYMRSYLNGLSMRWLNTLLDEMRKRFGSQTTR